MIRYVIADVRRPFTLSSAIARSFRGSLPRRRPGTVHRCPLLPPRFFLRG
jgi:hypothetical protein